MDSSTGENLGVKKALVFYEGKPPKGIKSRWIMHEYRLAKSSVPVYGDKPIKLKELSMRVCHRCLILTCALRMLKADS